MKSFTIILIFSIGYAFGQPKTNSGGGNEYSYEKICYAWNAEGLLIQNKLCPTCLVKEEFTHFIDKILSTYALNLLNNTKDGGSPPSKKVCPCENISEWKKLHEHYTTLKIDLSKCEEKGLADEYIKKIEVISNFSETEK